LEPDAFIMNILFLSRWFPFPANNGSKLRVMGLLRGLAEHHDVTLLSFIDQLEVSLDATELRSICAEVHVVPWQEFNPQSWRARLGLFSWRPRFLIDTHSSEMANLIRSLISSNKYDLVIASQLSMASYLSGFGGIPAIFEELELGQFHDKIALAGGYLKRLRFSLTWFKLRIYLARLLDGFRLCTVASEQEYNSLTKIFPRHKKKIATIPNCIQFEDYQGLEVSPVVNQLVYSGSFRFYANYEAMQWFVTEVFPIILEQIPDVRLLITGDHAGLPLPSFSNILQTGYVDDIKPVIASSSISLAPLLQGGGTRLKILEAMALGTPVVATSKGAEGLGAVSGEHLLIADSPEDFAHRVIQLLKNPILHDHISKNGKRFVKEKYNWETAMPHFLQLVERAAG
jgi:glycosyltransferase involved in cell wall biosynthesis